MSKGHLIIRFHLMYPQQARKFKKVQAKKLVKSNKLIFFREIAFLAVLNFFPGSNIDFWPFLKLQKMEFGQKKFHEIDLFDFMSFCGLDFFKFSGPLCTYYFNSLKNLVLFFTLLLHRCS